MPRDQYFIAERITMAEELPKWVKILSKQNNYIIILPLIYWIVGIPLGYIVNKDISNAVWLVCYFLYTVGLVFYLILRLFGYISGFVLPTKLTLRDDFDHYYDLSKKFPWFKSRFVVFLGCLRFFTLSIMFAAIWGGFPAALFLLMYKGSF